MNQRTQWNQRIEKTSLFWNVHFKHFTINVIYFKLKVNLSGFIFPENANSKFRAKTSNKKFAPPGNRTRVARMGILHDTTTPAALQYIRANFIYLNLRYACIWYIVNLFFQCFFVLVGRSCWWCIVSYKTVKKF